MSELKLIADKLDRQDKRLENIENTIGKIAVQDEKILYIQAQMSAIWKKIDATYGPEGIISKITAHQAACPKDRVKNLETRSWGIMVSILTIVLSGLGGILFFALRAG